jgi:hypothetical protein
MSTITKAQRISILKLWYSVCGDRGWKTSDRALRLTTIGNLLGREIASLDDVGRLDECTKVMAELKAMLGVSLKAGLEAVDPSRNQKRNFKWLIANETLPCLALYPTEANPDVPMGEVGAFGYLVAVMEGKSRYRKTDRPESEPRLEDFDVRTVEQIYWTLHARLQEKRKAAGHSGHDMCLAAGVRCKCAACKRRAAGPIIPPLPAGTDDEPTSAEVIKAEDPDWTA